MNDHIRDYAIPTIAHTFFVASLYGDGRGFQSDASFGDGHDNGKDFCPPGADTPGKC